MTSVGLVIMIVLVIPGVSVLAALLILHLAELILDRVRGVSVCHKEDE